MLEVTRDWGQAREGGGRGGGGGRAAGAVGAGVTVGWWGWRGWVWRGAGVAVAVGAAGLEIHDQGLAGDGGSWGRGRSRGDGVERGGAGSGTSGFYFCIFNALFSMSPRLKARTRLSPHVHADVLTVSAYSAASAGNCGGS